MLSRRDLVGKLAVGAAGVVALAASGTRARAAVNPHSANGQSGQTHDASAEGLPAAAEAPQEGPEQAKPGAIEAPPPAPPAPPWELLRPLTAGSSLAYGWRVADLSGPSDGACVLTLQNERGRVQRVHLCRNDGQPHGFVYTRRIDFVVMNGGRGDLGTEENLGQAVAAVAHVVAANESRPGQATVIDALLPHGERLQQFSAANEWTLR